MTQKKSIRKMNPETVSAQAPPYGLLLFFAILMIIGFNMGEAAVILDEATKICLSCIGIG